MNLRPSTIEKKGVVRLVVGGTLDDGTHIKEREVTRDGIADAAKELAALAGNPALADDFEFQLSRLLDEAELVARVTKAIRTAVKRKKVAAAFDLVEDLAHLPPLELAKAKAELKAGFGKALNMSDLARSVTAHQRAERADLLSKRTAVGDDGLLRICVNGRQLRDVVGDSLLALTQQNVPPTIFLRCGQLVCLRVDEKDRVSIGYLSEAGLRGRLERSANYYSIVGAEGRQREVIEAPPLNVCRDILALNVNCELQQMELQRLPALEAVIESPAVRADGTLLLYPGYDPRTRLYYAPTPGMKDLHVEDAPSEDDVKAALAVLDEVVCDFPFADEASRANLLGYLITPFVRPAIAGKVPLVMFDKPTPGTGGTLLAEAVLTIATGRDVVAYGAPADDEEWRKLITTVLSGGAATVLVDNVEHTLESDALARVITATEWGDRILGQTKDAIVPARTIWAVTGNNVSLGRNIARRVYSVRLDARMSDPHRRSGFRHPELLPWILQNRPRIVEAVLTLCRAWFAAGRPPADSSIMGSFEAWSRTVGGILAHAGVRGFLGNWEAMLHDSGEETSPWDAFLTALRAEYGANSFTAAQLEKDVEDKESLRLALPAELAVMIKKLPAGSFGNDKIIVESRFKLRIGHAFRKRVGMRFGPEGLCLERAGEDGHTKAVLWRVAAGNAEDAGDATGIPRGIPRNVNGDNHNRLGTGAGDAGDCSFLYVRDTLSSTHTYVVSAKGIGEEPRIPRNPPQTVSSEQIDPLLNPLACAAGERDAAGRESFVVADDDYDEIERAALQEEGM